MLASSAKSAARLITLAVPTGKIAYNPTLIVTGGEHVLAVRVESRDSHWLDEATWDPEVWFYRQTAEDQWERALDAPRFTAAEDPFATWVTNSGGQRVLVFGHVTLDRTTGPRPTGLTRFYQAASWDRLDPSAPFAEVRDMKDIRLCQLADGSIAVCGRPRGGQAGRGKVTYSRLTSLSELTHDAVWSAAILPGMIPEDRKIGNNELHLLPDGSIGVLGHIALGEEEHDMRYTVATWSINPDTGVATKPQELVERSDFPPTEPKLPRLADVVFPGSLERLGGDTWRLYAGLGDSGVGAIDLTHPF